MVEPGKTHFKSNKYHNKGHGGGPAYTLPTPNPIVYYQDPPAKRKLDPQWVDGKAQKWGEEWACSRQKLKTTQMRRFYDDLKAIERKILQGKDLQEQQSNFERDRALIMMFKAKAVYAEKRGNSPRAFTQFIFDHLASIHDLRDFQAFVKVFEAAVAFHRFFSDDK